ncbi:mediator of RNA polymerase II transcription subunit 13 [Orbilia blumenaviensis]|uniref:Mediator of RNA polymerase II transcription subunit 13 n=1 Tax=Orbilia blumenaviensis TaxID=1796055 RepID=A0AAV9VK19_9PEZI
MELPETCLTNVFKIDNLSEISYSVYRISSTFGSSPAWRVLSKAETNLRRRGKCVTTCPESSELWLFQIDNHGTDIAFTSDSGYNSYDGSGASEKGWEPMVWGLEEKTKDVLNTHEIFENLRPPSVEKPEDIFQLQALSQTDPLVSPGTQLEPIDLSGTHRDVYILQQLSKRGGSNLSMSAVGSPASGSRHGSSTAGTPHPTTVRPVSKQELVGQKLLLAMMSLLSYRLASSFSWLPLNLCTFLPKLDDEVDEESEILSYSPVSHGPALLTTISLSLSDDGSLHVTPKTIPQSALQRLSNASLQDTAESDVWLAPGGIIGRYMPKSNSDGLSHATPEWKAFVVKSLADRGIEIGQPNSIKWAHINIWSDIEGLIEIFWPTPLVFVRKYGGSETFPDATPLPGIVNVKSNTNTDEMNDLATQLTWYNAGNSLEFAEAWLSESTSRDIEKKRRLEARSKTIPAMDIDRKMPLVAPTTDRSGTVYPTPPDGPSGNDSHPTPGGPTTAPTPGQTKVVEEPTPVVEPPTAPPTAEATVNGTEMDLDDNWMKGDTSKVNDDIFGGQGAEMGDDLFIDITEDDFGFFDKIGDEDFTDVGLEKTQITTDAQPRPTTSHLSENMNDLNLGFSAIGYADDKLLDDMDLDLDDIGAAMDMQAEMQKDPISTQTGSDQSLSQPNGQGHKSVRLETQSTDDIQPTIVQIETPPLSPQRAMKLLLLDPQSPRGTPPLPKGQLVLPLSRRKSLYSPVGFPSFIGRSDEKYMLGGRFFCAEDESSPRKKSSEDRRFSATFPRVKKFRNSRRPLSRDIMFLEDEEERSDLVPDTGSSDEESSSTDEYESGDEEMFEVLNEGTQDNSSYSESPEGIRQGLKRKRIPSERDYWGGGNKAHGVEVLNSSDKLDGAPEWAAEMANLNDKDVDNLSSAQRTLCDFSSTDSPLDGVFKFVPDNDDISNRLSSQDFSHVVGLLQEQIVWNTYLISTIYPGSPSLGRISSVEFDANGINDQVEQNFRLRKHSMRNQDDVEDLLTDLFGGLTTRCSLETLVYGTIGRPKNSIYGVSPGLMDPHGLSAGLTPNRPKSASEPNTGPSLLFKIGAPHVHVHRNATLPNSAIELLPPALHFWDTFGLTPHSGSKDLLMASIFPTDAALGSAAKVYMESFSSTYENCRLGETLPVKTSQILDGLHGIGRQIQGKVQPVDEKALLRNYCDGIAKLGETLVEIEDELQNVVLFIVNPFDTPSSVLDICIAFHMLKKAYVAALNSTHRVFPNNIILQIVPIKNMAVHDGIAVQSHNQSIRSALEVYERCTLTVQDHHSQTFPQETYSPSVVLAKLPPKSIAFRVSSDPSPAILQENMCLHMAYAQSIDERWISVAWGDDCGDIKEVGNFCLGIPGTVVLRNFEDVCREIWAVTNKIISKKRVHWRISLVKVGTIDEDEVEFWTKLSHDCAVANTLTVFSSDPSPPLTFKCAIPSIMPQAFNGQAQLVGTPGATPQSSGVSPDQFGTSSSQGGALTPGDTPAPEIDNDMALVDFTDETWGALLLHPLNNSDSAITTRPALASGYLIKRSGPNETDEPAVLAVSLIRVGQRGPGMPTATSLQQSPAVSRSNEDLLRETLTQYRGLVTLAQHFGVTDMMKEVLPWHIAAVMKCRDVFSCVL